MLGISVIPVTIGLQYLVVVDGEASGWEWLETRLVVSGWRSVWLEVVGRGAWLGVVGEAPGW